MNRRTFTKSLLATFAVGAMSPLIAMGQEEEVYGRELMTRDEIREHRQNMRSLRGEEREAYLQEHRERMTQRAQERGVDLPDTPRGRPEGAGPDRGYGPRDGGGRPEGAGPDRGYGPGGGGPGGGGRGR
ncbi:hypothetical protein B1C78_04755 [Thioalkalivibrio denitrificans]|uniref:Uncharacterized protein n=1 Tax=Thioalkalivibrio denitrificans TaxID=108003 RepID=A0A1V3NNS5_9GAMM|nr:hypothetical protein [Thioalkalivibrio denitrificans]OOG26472.1 hypothetical protein B1C78_04755 [Thioalkalivibrio denitrificans]